MPGLEQKCSYCGRSNTAHASSCSECGTKLEEPIIAETISPPTTPAATAIAQPDIKWTAQDAWKFVGMLLVFEFVTALFRAGVGAHYPGFRRWLHTGIGYSLSSFAYYAIYCVTMLYFARTGNLKSFLQAFGLERLPSRSIWLGITVALVLKATGILLIAKGWSKGYTNPSISGYHHGVSLERYFYLASPYIMAPLFEELYMRGFLYRALRGSYSVAVSTFLVLGFTSLTHLAAFSTSWASAVTLSLMSVLVCTLRERTGNLWDCIICHFVFNISGAFGRFVFR